MDDAVKTDTSAQFDLPGEGDDSLDDFFAKKDKGKKGKKKKSKYVTTEALAKTLEKISTGAEEEEQQSKKEKDSSDANKGTSTNDGEEWHEYEDEDNRDYSDLKIQNFQISEKKAEVPEPQYNEEGELIPPKEMEGPWKNVTQKETPETDRPTVRKPEPTPEQAPSATKSVYRPPHARLSTSTASPGIPPGQGRRRKQEAPVINSEIDFPSLASAVQDTEQHVGFETVKAGAKSISRNQQQNTSRAGPLALGNQFEALRD